jgi:hypothetical protein
VLGSDAGSGVVSATAGPRDAVTVPVTACRSKSKSTVGMCPLDSPCGACRCTSVIRTWSPDLSTTSRVAAPLSSFGAIVMVYESMRFLRGMTQVVCVRRAAVPRQAMTPGAPTSYEDH